MHSLPTHSKVTNWLHSPRHTHHIRIGLGCSGGCDSVALLAWWAEAFPDWLPRTTVLHFNHRLRAEASDGDQQHVAELARRYGCAFHTASWHREADPTAPVSEEAARQARHAFFSAAVTELGLNAILLAHHKEDVLETMLMGLARGQGSRGLSSPRPVQPMSGRYTLLRPFLHATKAQLKAFLEARSITWREDASNFSDTYTRNRLRLHVIPRLLECIPQSIIEGAAQSRELLEEEDEALSALASQYLIPDSQSLNWQQLRNATPAAIRRRILFRWLEGQGVLSSLSRSALSLLWEAAEGNQPLSLSAGQKSLQVAAGQIHCLDATPDSAPQIEEHHLCVPFTFNWADLGTISAEWATPPHPPSSQAFRTSINPQTEAWLHPQALGEGGALTIRQWQHGDSFQPLGFPSPTSLSDLFINRKIPRESRKRLPIFLNHSAQILWVPGFPPCDLYKIFDGTNLALRLTWNPNMAVFNCNHANAGTSTGKTLT